MTYVGEKLNQCYSSAHFVIDPSEVYITFVSSGFPNPCGHALLRARVKIGKQTGIFYFHVPGLDASLMRPNAGFYDEPYYFHESQFSRYLSENKKDASKVTHTKIRGIKNSDTTKMSLKLQRLMSFPYAWKVIVHNCQSFVEEVLSSGSAQYQDQTKLDCPRIDLGQKTTGFLRFLFAW